MSEIVEPAELAGFRAELREWLEANAPAGLRGSATTPFQGFWGGSATAFESDDQRAWFELCLARGWTTPAWPRAYGGADMPSDDYRVF